MNTIIKFQAKEFKRMLDPIESEREIIKYVCYVQCISMDEEIKNWMGTNPRETKLTTNVAKSINSSLEKNKSFHNLNRGVLISAKSVHWNNKSGELTIILDDPSIHGNIDGGHTIKTILECKKNGELQDNRYVFFEIMTGINSDNVVEFAEARNTSVQVDVKSIAELNKSFEIIKPILKQLTFNKRIQYKMNEHSNDGTITPIDIREMIAILIMFNADIYPHKSDTQPVQSYSGKESSLRKFLNFSYKENNSQNKEDRNKKDREDMILKMKPIVPDIYNLYEKIETTFNQKGLDAKKTYKTRKYSRYDDNEIVTKSYFYQKDLTYFVPKGIIYPILGAFRALVSVDDNDKMYKWKIDPIKVWEDIGYSLVKTVLDEKDQHPEILAKNSNLWKSLFNDVYIYMLEN